jgi:hypothetical protein
MTSSWLPTFQLPNLPREQKLTYIEEQKKKLTEYIKFLDAQAAQHQVERPASRYLTSHTLTPVPGSPVAPRSLPGSPNVAAEEGFEAVTPDDFSGVLATGVKIAEQATQRGWFGWRSVSAPVPKPPSHTPEE